MPADRVLLLSCDYFNVPNEKKEGEDITGYSLWFVNQYRDSVTDKSKGFKPSKVSITEDVAKQLEKSNLPAVAELDYSARPGMGGKATLTVVGFKLIGAVNFDKLFSLPPQAA